MNNYLVGCEYAGKTTLSEEIKKWAKREMGGTRHFHDHMTLPSSELSPDAAKTLVNADPQVKEMFQRFMLDYHISPGMYDTSASPDANQMGLYIEEAVYAPLYYGYGGKNSGSPARSPEGQRTEMARNSEKKILELAPHTVLFLIKARPEVIRKRMREEPGNPRLRGGDDWEHFPTRGVVKEQDVEHVLQRFEEEFEASLIPDKYVIDTSDQTVEESFNEWLKKFTPHLTGSDKERMRAHKAK